MNIKGPSTFKEWTREIESALDEALSIQESSKGTEDEIDIIDIYKMAPAIAAIYRNIRCNKTKNKMREVSWSAVLHVHDKIPEYKNKHRRCFVHAYLDSMIYLKLMTRTKGEKIIDYLDGKAVVETWQA